MSSYTTNGCPTLVNSVRIITSFSKSCVWTINMSYCLPVVQIDRGNICVAYTPRFLIKFVANFPCVALQHRGHSFKPLEAIYTEKCNKVKEETQKVKRRHVELISFMQDVVSTFCFIFIIIVCITCSYPEFIHGMLLIHVAKASHKNLAWHKQAA